MDEIIDAGTFDTQTQPPQPKKRGRPKGKDINAENRRLKRQLAEMKENQRLKLQMEQLNQAEAEEKPEPEEADFLDRLRSEGYVLFGEIEPGINCVNAEEERVSAERFRKALGLPVEFRKGQAVRNYILEALQKWCDRGCLPLHLATGKFMHDDEIPAGEAFTFTPDIYGFPDGVDVIPNDPSGQGEKQNE